MMSLLLGFCFFTETSANKIEPGLMADTIGLKPPSKTDQATIKNIVEWYEAVGTVRPKVETKIEAQITAKVMRVYVTSGKKINKGDLLVRLDDRQFKSRLVQARQALKSAVASKEEAQQSIVASEAAFNQAKLAFDRTKTYFASQAATSQDMEKAESAYLQAKAGLERAQNVLTGSEAGIRRAEEIVEEAKIALGFTVIKAPQNGEVLKKLVEPGDLALPGKPLIMLQTEGALRLEAYVREGLISKVKRNTKLQVEITTLGKIVDAVIEEIVPYADPQTRTFLVKTTLPYVEGLYPGMFGKLLIPANNKDVVMAPVHSIYKIGQLELVILKEKDVWKKVFIKTGKQYGDQIEILSGLNGNELLGIKE